MVISSICLVISIVLSILVLLVKSSSSSSNLFLMISLIRIASTSLLYSLSFNLVTSEIGTYVKDSLILSRTSLEVVS